MERITGSVGASSAASQPSQEQLVWAVRIATPHVPHATCLTQVLAGQLLFERYGYPATVHIGVTTAGPDDGAFQARAWLESNGKVMIGESEAPYTPLITLH